MGAVIYTRSARPNRRSHEEQMEACERLIAELGYEVIEQFHDVGKARPGLDQLLATVRDGKASAVVAAGLDRLGRTFDTITHIMKTLNEVDVRLYIVGHGQVNLPTTPEFGIMRALAEYEAEHVEDDITR
ncbi:MULTISPECIES: recombinase family protein [Microbacterium]|uniref:recombinase family protein n=1 Tax=Microbacterium TaxID=33882 RepID=UPI00217E4BC6|nr:MULTISPECIES: recombinase family protein [Microbacterium]UWF78379.1 recombinase family protein [Microbacterium neungamense]WCM56556.1 recombinase family protein [Microbacterium sp. EF45047]